jgi:hypothetical protein
VLQKRKKSAVIVNGFMEELIFKNVEDYHPG